MKRKMTVLLLCCLAAYAFVAGNKNVFHTPDNFPEPVYNFNANPISKEKILLGRALFYDPILSKDNTISCASCHSPFTAFAHVDHALSHGIDNKIGTRNAPALINLAWQNSFMWDGSINHLDMQALFPISQTNEMNETIEHVVSKLQVSKIYPRLFYNAYGDSSITGEHTLKAISQFLLTVISANAKYDSVMRHETFFTEQETKGYALYKNNCATCHTEPLFTNLKFENNGLSEDTILKDLGRYAVTKNTSDSFLFKVPTLRNIEFSYPYMHDGRFKRLSDVMNHYTSDITGYKNLSVQLQKPIVLSSNDRVDLTAFLLTLTDKHFLFDTTYQYPKNILLKKN